MRALQLLAPVSCDIVRPADAAVRLPAGVALADYDGVAITGSALNIYDAGDSIERQIELARSVFASGVPCFGSCWGMQLAVTAAGGRVRANPLGREFGFARRIALNSAGRMHEMYRGKPAVFEAITVHRDDIEALPPGALALADSDMGLQAIEMRAGSSVFWGVQYHPEYSYADIAATAKRYAPVLLRRGTVRRPRRTRRLGRRRAGAGPPPARRAIVLAAWTRSGDAGCGRQDGRASQLATRAGAAAPHGMMLTAHWLLAGAGGILRRRDQRAGRRRHAGQFPGAAGAGHRAGDGQHHEHRCAVPGVSGRCAGATPRPAGPARAHVALAARSLLRRVARRRLAAAHG